MPDELELTPEDDKALNAACDAMAQTPWGKKRIDGMKARCKAREEAEAKARLNNNDIITPE